MPANNRQSRTTHYLNRRSRRAFSKSTIDAGPLLMTAIAAVSMLCLWSIGATLISYALPKPDLLTIKSRPFPQNVFDVWPNSDLQPIILDAGLLSSCLPQDDPTLCRVLGGDNGDGEKSKQQRLIGVLRPPGRLGQIMESFVRSFVEELSGGGKEKVGSSTSLHVIASHLQLPLLLSGDSNVDDKSKSISNHELAHIIRPAVLPPLLEALDLILQTTDKNETNHHLEVSVEEVEVVLRQVLRWHCRLTQRASGRALLTLYLDETLGYPKIAQEALSKFLGFASYDNTVPAVDMDPLTQDVLDTIDEASMLVDRIFAMTFNSSKSTSPPTEWANRIVEHELHLHKSDSCLSPLDFQTIPLPVTRTTELVGAFLEGSTATTEEGCRKYPASMLCQELFIGEPNAAKEESS